MRTRCVPSKILCPTLQGCKRGFVVFHRKRLEPWQQVVGVILFLCDAHFWCKFEQHCFNISRDILDSIFYPLSETIYDVITIFICIIQRHEYL